MKIKITSLILALTMIFTLLPIYVSSTEQTSDGAGMKIVMESYDATTGVLKVKVQAMEPDKVGLISATAVLSYDTTKLSLLYNDETLYGEEPPTQTAVELTEKVCNVEGYVVNVLLNAKNKFGKKVAYSVKNDYVYKDGDRAAVAAVIYYDGYASGTNTPHDDQITGKWFDVCSMNFQVASSPTDPATVLDSNSLRFADPEKDDDLIAGVWTGNNSYCMLLTAKTTEYSKIYYYNKMIGNSDTETIAYYKMAAEGNNTADYPRAAEKLTTPAQPTWDYANKGKITWTDVANAEKYSVKLYKDSDYTTAVVTDTVGAGVKEYTFTLPSAGTFCATVTALAGESNTSYTNSEESDKSDTITQLAVPTNLQWDSNNKTAKWVGDALATKFELALYKGEAEIEGAFITTDAENAYAFDDSIFSNNDPGSYSFKVMAVGNSETGVYNSEYSAKSDAIIRTKPLTAPTAKVTTGTDGSGQTTVTVTHSGADAASFDIQIYKGENLEKTLTGKTGDSTDVTSEIRKLGAGDYTIKVIAKPAANDTLHTDSDAVEAGKVEGYTIKVESVSLDISAHTLYSNGENTEKKVNLTAIVAPTDVTNPDVVWTTSDGNIATVVNGVVTAVDNATGTVTIKATSAADDKKCATCEITVKAHLKSVAITGTPSLDLNAQDTLTANLTPSNAEFDAKTATVTWTSTETAKVTVVKDLTNPLQATVTGVESGAANITVTVNGITSDVHTVTVACEHTARTPVDAETSTLCSVIPYDAHYKCNKCGKLFKNDTGVEEFEMPTAYGTEHDLSTEYRDSDDGHYRVCEREGCNGGERYQEPAAEHTFTEKIKDETHLANAGNCQTNKTYYYDCSVCAAKSTDLTFEAEKGDHVMSTEWTTVNEKHYHACTVEHCEHKTDEYECSGGTATCTAAAICETCEEPYGVALDHLWNDVYTSDDADETKHYYVCVRSNGGVLCGAKDNGEDHTVGTAATCQAQAVCGDCGKSYGQKSTVHKWSSDKDYPTDTTKGWHRDSTQHYRYCTVDGCTENNIAEGESHTFDENKLCTTCGYDGSCQHYNKVFKKEDPAVCRTGHVGKKAHWECANEECDKLFDAVDNTVIVTEDSLRINPDHVFEPHEKIKETCCSDGTVAYWYCTICKEEYGSSEVDSTKNHDPLTTIVIPASGPHTLNETRWYNNEDQHWRQCWKGTYKFDDTYEEHTEDAICKICGYINEKFDNDNPVTEEGNQFKIEKTDIENIDINEIVPEKNQEAVGAKLMEQLTELKVEVADITELKYVIELALTATIEELISPSESSTSSSSPAVDDKKVEIHDVKLRIKEDGGEWKDATEENFPANGLTVLLPYPEGTSGETHNFFVAHMITTASEKWAAKGLVPGSIETFSSNDIKKTPEGIVVTLSGLSPVAVSSEPIPGDDIDNYRFWYHTVYQLMAQKFNIRATAGEGGTITDMGNSEVKYDMSKTYTITPDEGYEIEAVYVNGRNIGPVTSYTFRSIKANQNISATFRKIAWANPFTDVAETDSYYEAIQYVYENGLYNGITLTTFEPETTMNRAMFVTVTGRLEGIREADYPTISFKDVAPGEWYSAYVEWASKNGIVLGYGDGNFGIEDTITVEQAVTILARYAAMKGINTSSSYTLNFADADKVSDWAEASMMWAVENGIYTGKDGMLNPQDEASRALVATMFYRFATTFID